MKLNHKGFLQGEEKGYLILESGEAFSCIWRGGTASAGEVVFNTSHCGYEEMATDPSYYSQILVCTAPMQGNYGVHNDRWESEAVSINGFVCLEIQDSFRESSWQELLVSKGIPVVSEIDTRTIVLKLRQQGTVWGSLVPGENIAKARKEAQSLIEATRNKQEMDWAFLTSCKEPIELAGENETGPRVAILDYGCKKNIIRALKKRCSAIKVFPSRSLPEAIKAWKPDGIMLSNGPGDPQDVAVAVETVRALLGWKFIFGICMGHHILSLALGATTYKLKFGHRGGNHPVKDLVLSKIYMTSQNHGYAVKSESLPENVEITHMNLNDNTVSGIRSIEQKCMSVQFHPESHPGPNDALGLFDYFVEQIN